MRKVCESRSDELGDVSTLADPSVVTAIIDGYAGLTGHSSGSQSTQRTDSGRSPAMSWFLVDQAHAVHSTCRRRRDDDAGRSPGAMKVVTLSASDSA